MDDRQRRRWLALIVLLTALGVWLLRACGGFAGFSGVYTAPLLLAGICAASGAVLGGLWLWHWKNRR